MCILYSARLGAIKWINGQTFETGSSGWLRQEEAVKHRSPLVRVILDLWQALD
ncbi:hypothetical protein CPB83DRAFT_855673, partial [Crepidotus variabilis]